MLYLVNVLMVNLRQAKLAHLSYDNKNIKLGVTIVKEQVIAEIHIIPLGTATTINIDDRRDKLMTINSKVKAVS